MEMLSFYALNIVVGCFMALTLGHFGIHLVGRRKTLETLMIGQTMQFGIIFGAFVTSLIFHNTGIVHEEHIGLFASLVISGTIYLIHEKVSKKWYYLKTEFALFFIIMAIAFSHIFTALNPLIESHFVRSFVGDIVTASKTENFVLMGITVLCGLYYFFKRNLLLDDSIDFGLYGFNTIKRVKGFEVIIFILMCISIHVFGLLFTLGMLLIPITFFNLIGVINYKSMLLVTCLLNVLAVITGFVLNVIFESLPTSPTIVICLVLNYLILFTVLRK